MKITDIEALPVSIGRRFPYAILVVLIRTDEGLTGIGEASLGGRGRGVLGILDHARDLLVGQDPAKIEHIWGELVHGTFWSTGQVIMSAVAGIDLALWDLKGKRLGVPIYELLGGPTRDKVRVYRHLNGDTKEELVEDALSWNERGFTVLRYCPLEALDAKSMSAWDPQRAIVATIKGTEALRTALGDDVELLLDAHTMFSPIETMTLARALEPYRLFFYEDPIRPFNAQSLRMVRAKTNVPLATGEQLSHKWEFQPLIEEELVDYLRIDLVHAGGITEAKKIMAAAEIHGQRSALHYASFPDQRHRLPPHRLRHPQLRHPGVVRTSCHLRTLPERPTRRRWLRRTASRSRARSGIRRSRSAETTISGRRIPAPILAGRRGRRLLATWPVSGDASFRPHSSFSARYSQDQTAMPEERFRGHRLAVNVFSCHRRTRHRLVAEFQQSHQG